MVGASSRLDCTGSPPKQQPGWDCVAPAHAAGPGTAAAALDPVEDYPAASRQLQGGDQLSQQPQMDEASPLTTDIKQYADRSDYLGKRRSDQDGNERKRGTFSRHEGPRKQDRHRHDLRVGHTRDDLYELAVYDRHGRCDRKRNDSRERKRKDSRERKRNDSRERYRDDSRERYRDGSPECYRNDTRARYRDDTRERYQDSPERYHSRDRRRCRDYSDYRRSLSRHHRRDLSPRRLRSPKRRSRKEENPPAFDKSAVAAAIARAQENLAGSSVNVAAPGTPCTLAADLLGIGVSASPDLTVHVAPNLTAPGLGSTGGMLVNPVLQAPQVRTLALKLT